MSIDYEKFGPTIDRDGQIVVRPSPFDTPDDVRGRPARPEPLPEILVFERESVRHIE